MSCFSRSGGNAIGLVNYLVEEQGVHLIEVSSGLTTITERGKASIYESLFHAYKKNLERKEIIIPNMKVYVRNGNRFGRAPIGYDHYGPRVRNGKFLSSKQRIEINEEGKLLQEAWKWKLTGLYSDAQILSKLECHGLKLSKQLLSSIWRNPFYCGVLINRLAEEPVKGNW
jgi:site-specific DNA recombinase